MHLGKHQLPNYITGLRILGSLILLFLQPFTAAFYIIYTLCGLSDVVDGTLARMTHSTSDLGARLDSIADLLFYTAMLYHLIPYLWVRLPRAIWYAVGTVLALRLAAYLVAAYKYRRFSSLHTYGNKLTGVAVFSLPYLLQWIPATPVCIAVCVIGGISSLEELCIHLTSSVYHATRKTIFIRK